MRLATCRLQKVKFIGYRRCLLVRHLFLVTPSTRYPYSKGQPQQHKQRLLGIARQITQEWLNQHPQIKLMRVQRQE